MPSNDVHELVGLSLRLARAGYRDGFAIKKAGVDGGLVERGTSPSEHEISSVAARKDIARESCKAAKILESNHRSSEREVERNRARLLKDSGRSEESTH